MCDLTLVTRKLLKLINFQMHYYYADNSEHRFNRFFTNENNASFFGWFFGDSCWRYVSRNRDTLYLGSLVRSNSSTWTNG